MITIDFEFLFNSISEGILFQDYEGRIIKVNRCAGDLLEISSEDLSKATFPDTKFNLIHKNGIQFQTNELPYYKALQSGEPTGEIIFGLENKKTKQRRWVCARSFPLLPNNNGAKKLIVTTLYDVTRYIKIENELREKEDFFTALFENKNNGYSSNKELLHLKHIGFRKVQEIAKVGSWIYTSNKQVVWSEETYRVYNRSPENFIPSEESLIKLIHPDDQPLMKEWIRACMAGEKPGELIFRVLYSDGSIHYISGRGELITDTEGKLAYMVGTAQDITDRINTENSLRRERWRLTSIIEATQVGTWEWDIQTDNIEINETWARIIGYTIKELTPLSSIKWIQMLYPQDVTRTEQMVERHLSGEHPFYVNEYRIKHKNGNWIWVEDRGTVMRSEDGKPIYMFGTHTDITERKKTEESLVHSHNLMHYVIEHSWGGIAIFDREMRYVYVSQQFLSDYGIKEQDIIGKCHYKVFNISQRWKNVHKRALAGEVLRADNDPYIGKDGTKYWTRWECRPWYESDGSIGGIILYAENITDRKRAEETLRANERLLRSIIDSSADYIYVKDADLRIIICNKKYADILGKSINELIGKTDTENGVPEVYVKGNSQKNIRGFEEDDLKALSGQIVHVTDEVYSTDNRVINLDTIKLPLKNDKGKIIGLLGISRDITERKQYEEKLERQTERLRNLHRTDQQILSTKPLETIFKSSFEHLRYLINCTYANIVLFDSELRKVEKVVSSVDGRIEIKEEEGLSVGEFVNQEMLSKGKIEIIENLNKAKTTTLPPVIKKEDISSYLNVPLRSEGSFIGILNIAWEFPHFVSVEEKEIINEIAGQISIAIEAARLRNETRIYAKELEKRVSERTAQLEAANRELEAFSYSVSHDLRAPLRAVDGFTRMLVDSYSSVLDNEGRRICSVIQESAKQMGRLIDDLLAFSRVGRTKLAFTDVNSELIVKSVFFDITNDEEKKRIEFRVEPLPVVIGDPNLIKQVWTNLISNAVKFTSKKEKAVIRVSAESQDEMVVFSIRDNGAGFDMSYADKLFGVFERLHSTKEFPGTGVGLAIVQRIILRHGGKIWAYSEVGKGATFSFTLKKKD